MSRTVLLLSQELLSIRLYPTTLILFNSFRFIRCITDSYLNFGLIILLPRVHYPSLTSRNRIDSSHCSRGYVSSLDRSQHSRTQTTPPIDTTPPSSLPSDQCMSSYPVYSFILFLLNLDSLFSHFYTVISFDVT